MSEPYRVLVTGSRDWADEKTVYAVLGAIADEVGLDRMVVIHGACPAGADRWADNWAEAKDAGLERHPAIWRPDGIYDPSAGFRRNAEMVAAGADVALAFLMPCSKPRCREPQPHPSHGASHCAGLAEKAGITVRRFEA